MNQYNSNADIKFILENLTSPKILDEHPWTKSRVVKNEVANDPSLMTKSPGQQLVATLLKLFRQSMPTTKPKHGKRLDTAWGQFGILAAQYFAPFVYGTIPPSSLRDAGGRIDQAIRYFVFNKPDHELSENELEAYCVVSDEIELIPISTLSDWQIKGIHKLAQTFFFFEQRLDNELSTEKSFDSVNIIEKPRIHSTTKNQHLKIKKRARINTNWWDRNKRWVISLIVLAGLIVMGIKVYRIYQAKELVFNDLRDLQNLIEPFKDNNELLDRFDKFSILISKTKTDFSILKSETKPLLWLSRALFWVPKYGGDLSQADKLLSFADGLIVAADETIQGVSPIIDSMDINGNIINLSQILHQLIEAQPNLLKARTSLNLAQDMYHTVDLQKLSPRIRDILIKSDPLIKYYNDGLSSFLVLPKLLGASDEGPQTYILLLQNEDELRATGGFLTGVATIVLENGKILTYKVEDSYAIDNPDQYYPPAPWQLERYMAASHWVFRDSNWSPDFPTTAKWAEMLFATSKNFSVDGVIAIDQESLQFILKAIGPINVENTSYPITSDNVIEYMRKSKSETPLDEQKLHRKDFMTYLSIAILDKFQKGEEISWIELGKSIKGVLDERHIQLQVDDPIISTLLSEHNWDGAIRANSPDYLFVVDSNIGFSKVNTVITEQLNYSVDLSVVDNAKAKLIVTHTNNAIGKPECNTGSSDDPSLSIYEGQINRCYLDYLRIYRPGGSQLLDATPHSVPAEMMPLNETIPAKVDNLIDENYSGIIGYGTLLYVPGGESLQTDFLFQLPSSVLEKKDNVITYALHIQKQSGTGAIPVSISIKLPDGAELKDSSIKGIIEGNTWTTSTNLKKDIYVEFSFIKP